MAEYPALSVPEPALRQHVLPVVDGLDGHRQLVRINPDEHLHADLTSVMGLAGLRGGHCYYEQGRPLWSHASTRRPDGNANRCRATPINLVGSREESIPSDRLNRVWPDTGPTGIV
jgi:hypothetical protein